MKNNYCGNLEINDIEYTFFLEEHIIRLVPKNTEECKLDLWESFSFDSLYGQLDNLRVICLLGVNLFKSLLGEIYGSVAAIVIGARNISEDISIEPINVITLKGPAINRFYNPMRILDIEKSIDDKNKATNPIVLVPPDERLIERNLDNNIKLVLGVASNKSMADSSDLIWQASSILRFYFDVKLNCRELLDKYFEINNLFRFMNFRVNVGFETIETGVRDIQGKYKKTGKLIILNSKEATNIKSFITINYEDIKQNIFEIYKNVNLSHNYISFLPADDDSAKHVDESVYLKTCAAFEYFYNKSHTNDNEDKYIDSIKSTLIETLTKIEAKTSDEQEIKDNVKKNIVDRIGSTSLKLKFKCLIRKEIKILEAVHDKVNYNSKFINEVSHSFAFQRNKFAHGDTDSILNIDIKPYIIALCLNYIMILRESDVSDDNIVTIVKKEPVHNFL